MVYDYVVTLKHERHNSINAVSVLAILLSAAAFVSVLLADNASAIFLVAALLLSGGLIYTWWAGRAHSHKIRYSKLLIVAGITWFAMPYLPWIGVLVLLLSLLEKPAKMPLEIGFTQDRIVVNNFFRQKYQWQSLNNVLLKDGLLTLDFKNNRILQKETIDEEGDAGEDEFNEYCHEQLTRFVLNR